MTRDDIKTEEDMDRYMAECDYFDSIRWGVEEEREKNRPRNLHDKAQQFLMPTKGAKGMLIALQRETRSAIYHLIEDQNQLNVLYREKWERWIHNELIERELAEQRKRLKDFKYLEEFISPHSRNMTGTVTPEMIARAKAFPISELIPFRSADGTASTIRCIFHSDKTPSLKYYPKMNHVHCYGGCGKKDSIDVVRHQRNLSFREAVLFLCGQK